MSDKERERVEKKYAYDKAWKKKNVERDKVHRTTYRRSAKGKLTRTNARHRRRAILKDGSCTPEQLAQLIASRMNVDGLFLCAYCKKYSESYDVEHIVPLSRGGLHDIENITVACPSCNRRKGNKTVEEFNAMRMRNALDASTVDSTHDRTNPDDSV
jgi:5-methylcytosine-specific restriction endonuclease McrA